MYDLRAHAVQYPDSSVITPNPEQSEACLTLNIIYTPSAPGGERGSRCMCSFTAAGSGNETRYDGTSFAENGVVMVNYRLSTLGFFPSQETY
ncbi:MAG: carboxylesterase family protein, partial [Tannerella sp.]|nr:carboxylesterase family protein [Tannerella sp.]